MSAAGMVPFARELIRSGATVVIAANEVAAINDCTAVELEMWLLYVAAVDQTIKRALADGTLSVASTGTDNCVIDLKKVMRVCCHKLKNQRNKLHSHFLTPGRKKKKQVCSGRRG